MLAVGGPLCIKVMKELNYHNHSNGFHNVWLAIRDGIKNTITMKRNNASGEMKKEFISWFRSHLKPNEVEIKKIKSEDQKADILTKGLQTDKFRAIRKLLCGW